MVNRKPGLPDGTGIFRQKIAIFGIFLRALEWKILGLFYDNFAKFTVVWSILSPSCIFV
jgi:hypothetical protein